MEKEADWFEAALNQLQHIVELKSDYRINIASVDKVYRSENNEDVEDGLYE